MSNPQQPKRRRGAGEMVVATADSARKPPADKVDIESLREQIGLKQVIGESAIFLKELQRVPRFARCDATVLISGESGTGKEIFARAIHYLSSRASRPFVPVNCAALPEHLVESEIFGHKRGAFTGATMDQAGLLQEAEGGTLFLDEIDSLTPQAQVKLLRFLQDGEYRAVGSQQIAHANIRVVAAANCDFPQLLRAEKFREDLFYRLNVLALALPPLRERRGDIVLLAESHSHFAGGDHENRAKKNLARRAEPIAGTYLARQRARAGERARLRHRPVRSRHAGDFGFEPARRRRGWGEPVVSKSEVPGDRTISSKQACVLTRAISHGRRAR